MADIFLSYAREDLSTARKLARVLEDEGWSVWWDHKMPAGATFFEVIHKNVSASRCVIVLWSGHSIESRWVKAEAHEGWDRRILVPAALTNDLQLPLPFKNAQIVSLVGWQGEKGHSGYLSLVEAISTLVGQARAVGPAQPNAQARLQPRDLPPGVNRPSGGVSWELQFLKWPPLLRRKWSFAVASLMGVSVGIPILMELLERPPVEIPNVQMHEVMITNLGSRRYQVYRGDVLLGTTPFTFQAPFGEEIKLECWADNKYVAPLSFTVGHERTWQCRE